MNPLDAYKELSTRSREIAHLDSAIELAYWDQRTNLPARGHAHRVRHLAAMAMMRYRRLTEPRLESLLSCVENSDLAEDPMSVEAANVREWRRAHDRLKKTPAKLAKDLARAEAEAEAVWEKTRPKNDWNRFSPYLEKVVRLKREEALALGFEGEPYNALIKEYEPDESAETIEPIFVALRGALVKLMRRIKASHRNQELTRLAGIPAPLQEALATDVARGLGYSLDCGRIDVSSHPFATGLGPGDVRIVSRFNENNLKEGLFGVIHEVGHAFYVQGLPLEHWGDPVCRPASLAMDESQALIWEFMVARSHGFWRRFYGDFQEAAPVLREIERDDFVFWVNRVNGASLRINADEVTYNLHIVLRFELERALINGDLEVKDLPDAWSAKSLQYLDYSPENFRQGVMQDVHWSAGLFGYFPTYSLGHIYAAQIYLCAERELGNLEEQFGCGDFSILKEWLRRRVHMHGARCRPKDLIRRITGREVDAKALISYLESKYEGLFGQLT